MFLISKDKSLTLLRMLVSRVLSFLRLTFI